MSQEKITPDLDEIFILEYTLMFGIAIIGCVFTFLVSIVKNSI